VLHHAWGAIDTSDPEQPAMGAVHAIRPHAGEHAAEFSIAVVDAYHGLGLGRLLAATLLLDACDDHIDTLTAHVLAENRAAIEFIRRLGAQMVAHNGPELEYRLPVADALARLRGETDPEGLRDVFAYFEGVRG